jgi:hypothetical protein
LHTLNAVKANINRLTVEAWARHTRNHNDLSHIGIIAKLRDVSRGTKLPVPENDIAVLVDKELMV